MADPRKDLMKPSAVGPDPYRMVRVPELSQVTAQAGINQAPASAQNAYDAVRPTSYDMAGRQAQLTALQRLQGYARGGQNTEDEAQQAAYTGQQNQYARGVMGAQQASRQMRGYNNPLLAGVAQQVGAQQQGMAANQQGLDMNAYAAQRALQSMSAAGTMASDIRGQQWAENTKRARARDIINQANVNANNTVAQGNVARANSVGQYNAGLPWQIAGVGEQKLAGTTDKLRSDTQYGIAKNQRQLDQTKDLISGGVQLGATAGKIAAL